MIVFARLVVFVVLVVALAAGRAGSPDEPESAHAPLARRALARHRRQSIDPQWPFGHIGPGSLASLDAPN